MRSGELDEDDFSSAKCAISRGIFDALHREPQFKKTPRLFGHAKGMRYVTPDGGQGLDGIAALWCGNAGHEIATAVERQLLDLDYAPSSEWDMPSRLIPQHA